MRIVFVPMAAAVLVAGAALAQSPAPSSPPPPPPAASLPSLPVKAGEEAPVFNLDTRTNLGLERRLSERELLLAFVDYWRTDPNRQRRVVDVISFATGQQQRIGFVSAIVRQAFGRVALLQPDIDRYLNFLRKRYPDIDFRDPNVLSVLKGNSQSLSRTVGGLLIEPNSVALFALIEPELAARGRLVGLENYLSRRGTWDPEGNRRIQEQIDQLRAAIGDGIKDPIADQERLIALQKLLKDQGVPIPSSAEGVQILVESILGRVTDISQGRNLPAPMDLTRLDPSGLVQRGLQGLEDRISAAEASTAQPE